MSDTITNILTKLKILGAAKNNTPAAEATVSAIDADHNALDVNVRGTPALAADAATATLQGTGNGFLQTFAGIVSAGRAAVTEASAASILAKLSADPSTATLQTTGNTSLASILAKIIAAPATEAKQDTGNTSAATTATQTTTTATNTGTIAGAVSAPDATLPASATQIGGVASTAAPSPVTSGRGVRAWFSLIGAQMVGVLGANGSAIASITNGVPILFSVMTSTVGATIPIVGVAIKAGPGILGFGWIKNSTGGTVYWQVHNSLATPAAGAVPHEGSSSSITNGTLVKVYPGNGMPGLHCDVGIWLVLSTTQYTYTAVASATSTYDLSYY